MGKAKFGIHTSEEREKYVKEFSWALHDDAAIETCRQYCPLVEIGAGTGYWASLIGDECDAYDIKPSGHVTYGTEEVLTYYGTQWNLFLCWPPLDDPMAYNCVLKFRGKFIIYIGEGRGGSTGDDKFHDLLARDFEPILYQNIPQWFGVRDYLSVWSRK